MTPAVVALETAGIAHTIHEYDRGDDLHDFGREAADSVGLDHDQPADRTSDGTLR